MQSLPGDPSKPRIDGLLVLGVDLLAHKGNLLSAGALCQLGGLHGGAVAAGGAASHPHLVGSTLHDHADEELVVLGVEPSQGSTTGGAELGGVLVALGLGREQLVGSVVGAEDHVVWHTDCMQEVVYIE